jgi:hypothetical protein
MQPRADPLLAVSEERLALRDLVGVVDRDVIDAARVNVEVPAEVLDRHHRALEMPTGRARAPRRVPLHLPLLARIGGAPHGEVGGVALPFDGLDPGPLELALTVQTSELAVVLVAGRVEVQATREPVAPPGAIELLCEADHLRDVAGRLRPQVGWQDAEALKVVRERERVVLGDLPDRAPLAPGSEFELVIALVRV